MKAILALQSLFLFGGASLVWCVPPVSNIHVTLRGKKYQVSDVSTVHDLQEKVKDESGIEIKQQGRVLFDGKRLSSSDVLSDVGVKDGAKLNLVPGKAKSNKSSSAGSVTSAASADADSSASGDGDFLQNMFKQAGVDPSQMDELMKNMPSDGKMPDMKESMAMMQNMMDSPIFKEFMEDPERLEQSRQMILQNPMLKGMMAGMPGMEELLNNPDAWREAMQAAANMYKNMDPNDMAQAIESMGGAGFPGGDAGGLFDGVGDAATTAALDELSEGE